MRPISSGTAPSGCLFLESLPMPVTNQAYQMPVPAIFLCWGFWGGITSTAFPCTAGWLLEKAVDIWSQFRWWPQAELQKRWFSPFIFPGSWAPLGRTVLRRMDGAVFWQGPAGPPVPPQDLLLWQSHLQDWVQVPSQPLVMD